MRMHLEPLFQRRLQWVWGWEGVFGEERIVVCTAHIEREPHDDTHARARKARPR